MAFLLLYVSILLYALSNDIYSKNVSHSPNVLLLALKTLNL